MLCREVAERLLAPEAASDAAVEQHLAGCERCARLAGRVARLDAALRRALVVEPPAELQARLTRLARQAGRPAARPRPAWRSLVERARGALVLSPRLAIAQGVAAISLLLAGWQALGWLQSFTPVLGDVSYALELVAASPAVAYLGGLQLESQGVWVWLLVGVAGWLVSESGPLGWWSAPRQDELA